MPRVSMSALEQGVDYPEWANESTLQTLVAAVSGLQRTSKDESDESQRHTTKSTNKLIRAIEGTSGRMGSGFGGFIEALWNPLKSYSMNFARLIRNLDQLDGSFNSLSNIMFDNNGIIGSAKGGMVFPVTQTLNVPICFVGVGEKVSDIHSFDPEAFVAGLLPDMEYSE